MRSGFTLVEMAVVLIIIGLLILTVFPALNASRSAGQRALTQSNLQALMLATAGFVQANGCLPCPTPPATTGTGFGHVRGDATLSPVPCGACAIAEGIPPYMALGVPSGVAHDGGGHWISMRVDPTLTLTSATAIVPPTKPVACTCAVAANGNCAAAPSGCACSSPVNNICTPLPAGISAQGLCANGLSSAQRITVSTVAGSTQQAAVLFVSHGSHGYGAFTSDSTGRHASVTRLIFPGTMPNCSANAGFARCNADGDLAYVNASQNNSDTDPYDDQLVFADRNALIGMLGGSACQTVW